MRFTQLKVELDELDEARVPPQGLQIGDGRLQIGDGQTGLIDRCAVRPSVAPASTEGGHNLRAIMASNALQLGHTYTRDEIHKMLGGGVQTFLPTKKGRVLCGCFKLKLNPFAPTQILVGPGPMRESSAQKAVTQGGSFPIFMKQARLAWEYVGEYRATRYVDREAVVRVVREAEAQGIAVVGVLYMEKA